jgi:hypothetical protein
MLLVACLHSEPMRRLSLFAVGVFVASLVLGALTPHCVAAAELHNTLAAAPSQVDDAGHPGNAPHKVCCITACDPVAGTLTAARVLSAPKLKMLAVLWPAPLGSAIAPLTTGAKPFSGVAARASPAHASGFSRTDRLLI